VVPPESRQCQLTVKVKPGAVRDEVVGLAGDVLRVRVAAPPVKGRANAALVALLARTLGVDRGSIAILRGATGRTKVVAVQGLGLEEALRSLVRQGGAGFQAGNPSDRV
jgi:hypothetical protein